MDDKTKPDKLHAEELKELILLKCSSHPNSSTDSMEYIKKSHWHFFYRNRQISYFSSGTTKNHK